MARQARLAEGWQKDKPGRKMGFPWFSHLRRNGYGGQARHSHFRLRPHPLSWVFFITSAFSLSIKHGYTIAYIFIRTTPILTLLTIIFVTGNIPAQPPEGERLMKLENHQEHRDHMEKVFHLALPVRQSPGDGGSAFSLVFAFSGLQRLLDFDSIRLI